MFAKNNIMQKIPISAKEAIGVLRITPGKFVQLLDLGRLPAETIDGVVVFDLHELRKANLKLPKSSLFPKSEYASAGEAMALLGISRRTFYIRVAKGEVRLHKDGRNSFVKLVDLYTATDALF